MAVLPCLWSNSEPGVDTVGIYVEIIIVDVENSLFRYDLTIGNLVKRAPILA